MRFSATASDLDFIVPEIWEGPSEELHLNTESAKRTNFGGRILSGITSLMLMTPELIQEKGWDWPRRVEWQFTGPIAAGTAFQCEWESPQASAQESVWQGRIWYQDADGENLPLSVGQVHYGRGEEDGRSQAHTYEGARTAGRTVFAADAQVFNWWTAVSRGVQLAGEGGNLPWPVFISLGGGLSVRSLDLEPFAGVINRAMNWDFYRELKTEETVRGIIYPMETRKSRSLEDWVVGRSVCDFHSEGNLSDQVASLERTLLFRKKEPRRQLADHDE